MIKKLLYIMSTFCINIKCIMAKNDGQTQQKNFSEKSKCTIGFTKTFMQVTQKNKDKIDKLLYNNIV